MRSKSELKAIRNRLKIGQGPKINSDLNDILAPTEPAKKYSEDLRK